MIFPITNWAVPIYEHLKGINKIVLLFICAELTKIVGFLPPISSTIIYGIIIIYAIHCLLHTKNYESIYLGLLSYIPLQILITSPNVMFSPWQRYLLFAIIIITCSGMCQSEILRSERGRIFEIICFSCAIIGVGSFFARFLGINYMQVNGITDLSRAGIFGGLASHSMLLGPTAGVGSLYIVNKALENKSVFLFACSILCLASVLFASSRSAFLSTIAAGFVYLHFKTANLGTFFKYFVAIFILLACSIPLWQGAMKGLIEKQNGNVVAGSTFASREDKWDQRFEEFKSNPICGYGFVSVDPTNKDNSIGAGGQSVEPGSSWLSVLSMTGIIGLIFIGSIYVEALLAVAKNSRNPFLFGVITLLTVNMFTEGYIFFGGSFLSFLFWITIGVCRDQKYLPIENLTNAPNDNY